MTTATATYELPSFRTHSRFALLRALCVVALCAALTAGFLAQVWRAPAPADADASAAIAPAPAPYPTGV
jgi:hypothetical protein